MKVQKQIKLKSKKKSQNKRNLMGQTQDQLSKKYSQVKKKVFKSLEISNYFSKVVFTFLDK